MTSPTTERPLFPAGRCCAGVNHHTDDCETRKTLSASYARAAASPLEAPLQRWTCPRCRESILTTHPDEATCPSAACLTEGLKEDPIEAAVALLESVPFGRIRKLRPEQEKAVRDLLEVWP